MIEQKIEANIKIKQRTDILKIAHLYSSSSVYPCLHIQFKNAFHQHSPLSLYSKSLPAS